MCDWYSEAGNIWSVSGLGYFSSQHGFFRAAPRPGVPKHPLCTLWGQLPIIRRSIHIVALDLWPQDVGPSVVMDFELIDVLTKDYSAYRKVL